MMSKRKKKFWNLLQNEMDKIDALKSTGMKREQIKKELLFLNNSKKMVIRNE